VSTESSSSLRRACLGLLAAAAVTVGATSASAQTTPYAFNRYEPAPAGETFFAAQHPWYSPGDGSFGIRGGLVADYAYRPLVARMNGTAGSSVTNVLIEHMLLTHLQLGIGFIDRINVHLNVPLALVQSGAGSTATSFGSFSGPAVGDIRLGARVRIFGHADRDPISLHFGANFFFNSGLFGIDNANASSFTNVSDNRFRGKADLTLAGRASVIRYSLGVGFHYRDVNIAFSSGAAGADGHELYANAGLGVALLSDRLTIGAEGWLTSGISNFFGYPWTNAEVLGGVHYLIADTILVGAGAGPGLELALSTKLLDPRGRGRGPGSHAGRGDAHAPRALSGRVRAGAPARRARAARHGLGWRARSG
jgi:OOP family OmpA-OmpF porin